MAKISKHFSDKEFRCPESGVLFVDPELLTMLDALRDLMGCPLYVTSGCRSPEYNAKIGGAAHSLHITTNMQPCQAADIKAGGGNFRYRLIMYAIEELGFTGVGVYKNHIHLDIRDKAPSLWWG